MSIERILLKGGCVLTLDPDIGNYRQGDVLIEGAKITSVGPRLRVLDAEVIDCSDMIVMPGFIDTHRHIWEGILKNIAPDALLDEYFRDILGVLAPVYRPQDAYAGNLVSALGAIDCGVTTLLDWSHIQNTPEHTDAAISALQESGLRSVFAYGTPNLDMGAWWHNSSLKHPTDVKRVATQYFSSPDQLLTLALAPRGPEFTTFDVAKHDWDLAREVGIRISVHVGVGAAGKHGKLGAMGKAGLLGPDTTYIHCCTLSDEELQMIADTGGTVSIAAPVEMQMGHGMPPVQRCLDRGLRPSLSVDVETTVSTDLFAQMRSVLTLQRGQINEQRLAGGENLPPVLTSRDVMEFATIEGARATGLERKVGTLTPGKEADIILLRTDRINVLPINDPIGVVVRGMDSSNVDSVFIAGKARKRRGQLLDVDMARGETARLRVARLRRRDVGLHDARDLMTLKTYLLSLPERVLRSGLGLGAGVAREVGEVALPDTVKRSRLYQNLVDSTLRFLIEQVGGVEGAYAAQDPLPDDFLTRRAAGNVVEALGLVAFRASPVWVLAALADVCGMGRQLIPEIADALKEQGLLEKEATFTSVDQMLDGLERTSSRLATTINTPPLDVASLRQEWQAIRDESRGLQTHALPSRETLTGLWSQLRDEATRQERSVFETSTMLALSAAKALPDGARWLSASAVVGASRTGQIVATALFDHYRTTLGEIQQVGYATFAARQLGPYVRAAVSQFSPEHRTLTERFLDRRGGSSDEGRGGSSDPPEKGSTP